MYSESIEKYETAIRRIGEEIGNVESVRQNEHDDVHVNAPFVVQLPRGCEWRYLRPIRKNEEP